MHRPTKEQMSFYISARFQLVAFWFDVFWCQCETAYVREFLVAEKHLSKLILRLIVFKLLEKLVKGFEKIIMVLGVYEEIINVDNDILDGSENCIY